MPTLRERHLYDGVAKNTPLIQRYARALTGNAVKGKELVRDMQANFDFDPDGPRIKAQLFTALQHEWARSDQSTARGKPHEMFLLHRMEGFSLAELSRIFDLPVPFAFRLLSKCEADDRSALPTRVLVLERDALVTIDLCACLEDLGYKVVGIARTLPEATLKAQEALPNVLISETLLTDGSTGRQSAVAIAVTARMLPTIFIDAPDPAALLEDDEVPSFPLDVPFLTADVEAVMRQAESLSRYEASKALL